MFFIPVRTESNYQKCLFFFSGIIAHGELIGRCAVTKSIDGKSQPFGHCGKRISQLCFEKEFRVKVDRAWNRAEFRMVRFDGGDAVTTVNQTIL